MKRAVEKKLRYLAHLALILITMFIAYPIGDYLFDFQGPSQFMNILKMFGWFFLILLGSDLLYERLMRV